MAGPSGVRGGPGPIGRGYGQPQQFGVHGPNFGPRPTGLVKAPEPMGYPVQGPGFGPQGYPVRSVPKVARRVAVPREAHVVGYQHVPVKMPAQKQICNVNGFCSLADINHTPVSNMKGKEIELIPVADAQTGYTDHFNVEVHDIPKPKKEAPKKEEKKPKAEKKTETKSTEDVVVCNKDTEACDLVPILVVDDVIAQLDNNDFEVELDVLPLTDANTGAVTHQKTVMFDPTPDIE